MRPLRGLKSQLPGICADRARTNRGKLAKNMATQRPASDQDNQKPARTPPSPRPCSLAASITTLLYSTTVSQSLRKALRSPLYSPRVDQVVEGFDRMKD